jgi:DNA-binding NtrC family response regulator
MKKLLIVDNDDELLSSLEALFKADGFDTHSTWSAREALQFIRTRPCDVMLVGDYLPDLYYGEFLKQAAQYSGASRIILMQAGTRSSAATRHPRVWAKATVDKINLRQIRDAVFSIQFC